MNKLPHLTSAITAIALIAASMSAQEISPIQADARPFGLEIVGEVYVGGSDERSKIFQSEILPILNILVNENLNERISLSRADSLALDPSQLKLATDAEVRVYFVGEGAGYTNTLGYNVETDTAFSSKVIQENSLIIFPDASSMITLLGSSGRAVRTANAPLLPGDFAELGAIPAGSFLDFFLIANGANPGLKQFNVFTADPARNPDKIQHVVAFALEGSPYLLIGFEDLLNGGDRDFNDVLFAVEIGEINVQRLMSTPEPAVIWSLGLGLVIAAVYRKRIATQAKS